MPQTQNSGQARIIRADAFSFAVQQDGPATANSSVHITNAGTIQGPILTRAGADQFIQTAGSQTGDVTLGAGVDTLQISGGSFAGSAFMGDGDDVATLSGSANVAGAVQFDGGAGNDVMNVDGLNMRVYTAPANDPSKGSNLTLWETLSAMGGAQLRLTGDLTAAATNIDAASTLNSQGETTPVMALQGNLNLAGTLTQTNGAANNITTITGNYVATGTPTLAMDVVLGNDSSLTDKLVVTGDTSGTTTVQVSNLAGIGALTGTGIEVVQVNGNSAGTFVLPGLGYLIAGAYRYDLVKVGSNWFLQSRAATPAEIAANTRAIPVDSPIALGGLALVLAALGAAMLRRKQRGA